MGYRLELIIDGLLVDDAVFADAARAEATAGTWHARVVEARCDGVSAWLEVYEDGVRILVDDGDTSWGAMAEAS